MGSCIGISLLSERDPATRKLLRSDQGSNSKNWVVKHLASRLKVELDYTPVYSPWLNGTVERLNKYYSLDTREWPYLVPAVQANRNHASVHSLAGHAPIEVFN
ncbi:hypothetical protein PHMEG_0005806 [Phytophthora megakarya]|uniref:Integrase catalytic domain-containing protein n=1 Tax=Phytophthora megakarya TaxID=4795 RepID=A0A225WSC5_9STRA|nr:hypothetical protein PHMEG_0005806 [Phytophthora megakarya]